MRSTERLVGASQLLLIFPALLFMGSLVVRNLSLPSNEPARTAHIRPAYQLTICCGSENLLRDDSPNALVGETSPLHSLTLSDRFIGLSPLF